MRDGAQARIDPRDRSRAPLRLGERTTVWLRDAEPPGACDERAEIFAEESRGLVVGRAAYTRVYGPRAALTLDVADAYWQPGLPAALLVILGQRAAAGGISTFLIRVPAPDDRLLALLTDGFGARISREGGAVAVELAVAPQGS